MVARYDKDQEYLDKLNERRRREQTLDREQELHREFLLEQVDELAADFVESPEQIGYYISDLEAAGMLSVADKGMLFRRLWELMGPAFADRAFNMTERAIRDDHTIAHAIADDMRREQAEARPAEAPAALADPEVRRELDRASELLLGLSQALGLDLDLRPAGELASNDDRAEGAFDDDALERISDPDAERARKTREVLDVLAPQLGLDPEGFDVKVDEEAYHQTELQGIYGLMADGTVFLNPEVYDPETPEGRGLLAHEVSHIAQRDNLIRGAADVPADIAVAEAEAHEISHMFAEGGAVSAPLASLDLYDQAACGPRDMQTPGKPEGTVEVVEEPAIYEIVENEIKVPNVNFPFDEPGRAMQGKSALDAAGYREHNHRVLRTLIQTVATYPEITGIFLFAHTDHRGNGAYNQALSFRRAQATVEWLRGPSDGEAGLGIKLSPFGYGKERPLHPSSFDDGRDLTEEQHRENRRTEFRITEVNGQEISGPFKPTRKVLVQPGRKIIRYLDAEGNVIKEEIVVDGQEPQGLTPEEQSQSAGDTQNPPAPTPAETQPSNESAAPQAPGGAPAPLPQTRDRHVAIARRGATPALRTVKQPGIRNVVLPKAGPGGLKGMTVEESTRSAGGGEPLPSGLKERFESAFATDFSDVRIHRGSTQATSVGATAFARGSDIHFAPGRFDADSQSGLDVLGHELTHIVQQRAGRVTVPQNRGANVNVDRALEAEADLLGARAARGERVSVQGSAARLMQRADIVQYEGGEGAGGQDAPPSDVELKIAGQTISARMPQGASPGVVRVDFSDVEFRGVQFGSAQVRFSDSWEIQGGSISASVTIGDYVEANDVELRIERREVRGKVEGHISAEIRGARLNVSELFDTTIDLSIGTDGISGRATIDANTPITLGQGITLNQGSLTVSVDGAGTLGASGTLVGTIEGLGQVTVTASAMTDGHLSGSITLDVQEPLAVPGVEGVTIESGGITGEYTHGQSWTIRGDLQVNVRDWVGADISASYTHQSGEEGGEASGSWELRGLLTQRKDYSLGEDEDQLTFSNGELDLGFKDAVFEYAKATVDYATQNWKGNVQADFDVPAEKISGKGTIELAVEELPIGDTGARLTAASAEVTVEENSLKEITGELTAIFPYEDEDTFKLEGEGLTYNVPDSKVSGSVKVTTMRKLSFGDEAEYNGHVEEEATATVDIKDNALLGITGGLEFKVNHGESQIGEGSVDVNFEGENNSLNATAKFTLTDEQGFGIPDRLEGPVKLLPGGEFEVTIEDSELALAQVKNVAYQIKQTGEEATGVFAGEVNGSYDFRSSKLNVTGDGAVEEDWPLVPGDGVNLKFTKGGSIDVVVTESKLTTVSGKFPFECTIDENGKIPQLVLKGEVEGDYSDETGHFSGKLTAKLEDAVPIPIGDAGDVLTIQKGASLEATVTESQPGKLTVAFEADYEKGGELFLQGNVENASYDFKSGNFDFKGELVLKQPISQTTEDEKWKLVVEAGADIGVEVEESKLKMLTGSIPFEVHDPDEALFKGNLSDLKLEFEGEETYFTGELDVTLGRDLTYPRDEEGNETTPEGSPPVSLVAKKDVSRIFGSVERNAFQEIGAEFHFGVNIGTDEYGAGELKGTLDMTNHRLTASGQLVLVKDFIIGGEEKTEDPSDPTALWILAFEAGQGLDASIKNNVLDEANINLGCKLYHNLTPVAIGSVNGRYKLGETETFEGSATVDVIENLDWYTGDRFQYWVEKGTNCTVVMKGTTVESAKGAFKLLMQEGTADVVRVEFGGDYTPGTGFSATGNIEALDDISVAESGEWAIFVAKGSAGNATVEGLEVKSFNGDLTLLVRKGEPDFAKGVFNIDYQLADSNPMVTASGTAELLERTEVGASEDGLWKFYLCPSTGVDLQITNNELEHVKGTIVVEGSYKDVDCLKGELEAEYIHGQEPKLSAKGQISLTGRIEVTPPGGIADFKVELTEGTGIGCQVTDNSLEWLDGQLKGDIFYKDEKLAKFDLGGKYTGEPAPDFSGSGTFETVAPIKLVEYEGWELYLDAGADIAGSVKEFQLEKLTSNIPLSVYKGADHIVRAKLSGEYIHAGPTFNGTGEAEIVTELTIAENVGAKNYSFYLEPGTGASVKVTANNLDEISGQLIVTVSDSPSKEGKFLKATAEATYTQTNGGQVTASGKLEVTRRTKMLDTQGGYAAFLDTNTEATIELTNNNVDKVSGQIHVAIEKPESSKFAWVKIQGEYTEATGFNGSGEAELEVEHKIVEMPIGEETYSLWAMPGTGAKITLTNSDIDTISGQVIAMIRDAPSEVGNFIEVTATNCSFNFKESKFDGSGSAQVLKDKKLAEFNGEQLWLASGTGVQASVQQNALQQVGGNITLKLKDEGDFYLTCKLEGSFDAAGGTGFSGGGEVTITRQKQLAELAGYKFFLDEGTGAKAVIDQNKLTEVSGNVPFQVHDDKGCLIKGHADGKYVTATKKFSGSGDVRLGRDLEFNAGGGIVLKFKEGSGGGGEVVDNELRKLTGTLKVDIADSKGDMVGLEAEGEFDVVNQKIIYVEGGAKLLRPIDVGGEGDQAILRVTRLEGSARVENNELKWIKGALGFKAPRLMDMEGEVEGGWSGEGGQDVFWGKGWVNFTIFDEPAQGRYCKGKIDFEYFKSGDWTAKGEVDYQLNDMLGGKVNVECDQTLDPVIGGEIRVQNVVLMPGRDIFKWEKVFNLIQQTAWAGPVPIDINGGVAVGIGLSMQDLTFSTTVGFSGWRPLSAATKVPDFHARADLNTGLRFVAALKPWLGLGLGVSGVASAGVALQGEVSIGVDVNVNPFAEIEGKGGVYSGRLGIGLNVVGSGSLGLTPQLYATLLQTWKYDLPGINYDLGQLFSFDYNYAFPFGDQPGQPEAGGGGASAPTPAAGSTQKVPEQKTQPSMPAETSGAPRRPAAVKGGPDANAVDTQAENERKQEGPMDDLMRKLDDVKEWANKVGCLAKVGGTLVTMLTFAATFGPLGPQVAIAYFAYELLTGNLTFDEIRTAFETVFDIIRLVGQAALELLPDWLRTLWDRLRGKSWDQILGDMIRWMADKLLELFPGARRIVNELIGVARDAISTITRIITRIRSGGFGFDDFLDICRTLGGAVARAVAAMVGDAVVDGVRDAGRAVVNFVTSPPW